jgi:hypothetical protein
MTKKTKKKPTAPSVSPSSLPSEPSPAPTQPLPNVPLASSAAPSKAEQTLVCSILDETGTYSEFQAALQAFISSRNNVSEVHLAQLWNYAYQLGTNNMAQCVNERIQGIRNDARKEGKEAEKANWLSDGHRVNGECRANWNPRMCSSIQTDCVKAEPVAPSFPVLSTTATAVQTEPAPLDWAEEMADIPIHSTSTTSSVSTPRDLSALRSGSIKPFASLQRRAAISRSRSSRRKFPYSMLPSQDHSRACPLPSRSKEKSSPSHSTKFRSPSQYDWSSSLLVLSDIARALGDMGWKPPSFFNHAKF